MRNGFALHSDLVKGLTSDVTEVVEVGACHRATRVAASFIWVVLAAGHYRIVTCETAVPLSAESGSSDDERVKSQIRATQQRDRKPRAITSRTDKMAYVDPNARRAGGDGGDFLSNARGPSEPSAQQAA